MAGVNVALSSMVYCSGVMSVECSASPSAALEYALCTALSCENTSPIFSQMDVSGKLCPGNFFIKVFVTVLRLGTLVFFCYTRVWRGGFKAFGHNCYLSQVFVHYRLHHSVNTGKMCQTPDWDESSTICFDMS